MAEYESNKKEVTNVFTEDMICVVISGSIKEIMDMSEDENFKKKCCDLVKTNTDEVNLEMNLKEYFLKFVVKHPKKRSLLNEFFNPAISKQEYISLESLIKDMFLENVGEDMNTIEELTGFDSWSQSIPEDSE